MFGILKSLDVTKTHSISDAVWFYVTGMVLMVGLSTVLGHVLHLMGVVETVGSFFEGGHVYTLIGTGFVLMVSSLILTGRKMTGDLFSILLVGIAVYLSFTTSLVLGMVPVAILTTLSSGGDKTDKS